MRGLVVILCRNTLTYSRACLKTLLAQTVPVDILVIDNASTDGTTKYMTAQQALHPNIYRMTFPEVRSVAASWNAGLAWAWQRGHERALVVNSDTELLEGTYERLEGWLEAELVSDRRAGMITAVGVDRDPAYPENVQERPNPDYSCFMIERWAHRAVPFDEGYEGAYYEDSDSHVRLYRSGIWAGSINLGFLHRSSGTLKLADPVEAERIHRHYATNKQRFYRQYGTVPGTKGYERLFLPGA